MLPLVLPVFALILVATGCSSSEEAQDDDAQTARAAASPSMAAPAPMTPAPSPAGSDGAAARATTQTTVAPVTASTPDAGAASAPAAAAAPARTFASCTAIAATYDDCELIHVTVAEPSSARCIQLTVDNCGSYGRQGLSAELPPLWRLASASVRSRVEPCELGVFYPDSTLITAASGSISWDESGRLPTALEIDVTLEASSLSGMTTSVDVSTGEPLNPVRCED